MKNFKLPMLPYDYKDLEPHMDEATMRIHHDKHHAAYTANFNKVLENHPEIAEQSAEDILKNIDNLPEDIRGAIRNHGGGYVNHNIFWESMTPAEKSRQPEEDLLQEITKTFGSFEKFKEKFTSTAMTIFGSGWAWLSMADDKLIIEKTSNQDSPYSLGHTPLLGLDVWEHAYYLKYQNKRAEFVENFFNVINWSKVAEKYNINK